MKSEGGAETGGVAAGRADQIRKQQFSRGAATTTGRVQSAIAVGAAVASAPTEVVKPKHEESRYFTA